MRPCRSQAPVRWSAPARGRSLQRGFAASGKTLDPASSRGAVCRLSSALCGPYRRSHPALSGRRQGARGVCARRLAAGGVHQQDRKPGHAPDRKARDRRPFRLRLRPGHLWRRQARPQAAARDHRGFRRREGARDHGRGFRAPTSRPPAPPDLPVIAVDFGYSDAPVAELGPDRVISHFDQLAEACDALLAPGRELCARTGISPWTARSKRVVWRPGSEGRRQIRIWF